MVDFEIRGLFEVFKLGVEGLNSAAEWAKTKNSKYDFIRSSANKYLESLEKRYGNIKIMGMQEPINLLDLYTRVQTLQKPTSSIRFHIDFIVNSFDHKSKRSNLINPTKDGESVLNELDRFILLGKPGSGKTTFMKFAAISSAKGILAEQKIPVFISLKDFSDSDAELIEFIEQQFEICNFPSPREFVIRSLQKGKMLLLFDGLDEIAEERKKHIIRELKDFSDKYPSNKHIISCRIAYYNSFFDTFSDVEIADFNLDQIDQFVTNWFRNDCLMARKCFDLISNRPQLAELSSTPLLLTLLCITYESTLGIPESRSELYKEAVDALLNKWDSTRGIERDIAYKRLSLRRKEGLFAKIASISFSKNEYFFRQRTLEKYIQDYVDNINPGEDADEPPHAEAILKSIEAQHGIFVERAKGIYSFSHLTFHEYFVAKHISEASSIDALKELTEKHIFNRKWREVFLLIAELIDSADDFLESLLYSISIYQSRSSRRNPIHTVNNLIDSITPGLNPTKYGIHITRPLAMFYIFGLALEINRLTIDSIRTVYFHNYRTGDDDIIFDLEMHENILRSIIEQCGRNVDICINAMDSLNGYIRALKFEAKEDFPTEENIIRNLTESISDDFKSEIYGTSFTDEYGSFDLVRALEISGNHIAFDLKTSNMNFYISYDYAIKIAIRISNPYDRIGMALESEDLLEYLDNYVHINEIVLLSLAGDCIISKENRERLKSSIFSAISCDQRERQLGALTMGMSHVED